MTRAVPIAFALALLAGCFQPGTREVLQDEVRNYHDALRWRRFGEAALHLPPARRPGFLDRAAKVAEDVQIADYEIRQVAQLSETRVEIHAALEWESRRTGLVRKTELAELWERKGSDWILVETRQLGGEKLPFFDATPVGAAAEK